jgi:hypothetical protein
MTEWIRCEERMPPEDEVVLVYTPEGRCGKIHLDVLSMAYEYPVSWSSHFIEIGIQWVEHDSHEITHWMPLPNIPM